MRCYKCGNKVTDGLDECPGCNTALWAMTPTDGESTAPMTLVEQDDPFAELTTAQGQQRDCLPAPRQQSGTTVANPAQGALAILAGVMPGMRSICGLVIIAEPPHSEQPDWDVCKIITRILWIILLFPFIVVAVVACLIFGRSSPVNLFAMLGVFRFLNPAAGNNEQVPVRYFRIREDGSDAEVMVRIKGHTYGSIGVDDSVTLCGWLRGGTLYARHGYNHRTGSTIRLAGSYSWIGLVITLILILALVTANVARTISSIGGAQ